MRIFRSEAIQLWKSLDNSTKTELVNKHKSTWTVTMVDMSSSTIERIINLEYGHNQ